MKKAIALLSLLVLLFSSGVIYPENAEASSRSLEKVQQERQLIKNKLSNKEKEIVKVLDEINAIHKEITDIENELEKNNQKRKETETKIVEYEEQLYDLLDEISELNKAIKKRNEILKNRLSAYQQSGGDISFLEVLLNAKTFTEFISRVSSVTAITTADRELIEQQTEDREKLEEHQKTLEEKIEKQQQLIEKLEETNKVIEKQKEALKSSEKQLKNKEAQLKKEKEKLSSEDDKLKKLEQSYRNEMQQREQQNSTTIAKTSASSSTQQTKTSQSTKDLEIGKTYRMVATAYTPFCKGCSGVTSTGISVKSKQHQRIIAVDPSIIPLGSRVWVEGYGEAIAADTGSAIKGNKIDVLFKSEKQALQWGRRTVTVKVLK